MKDKLPTIRVTALELKFTASLTPGKQLVIAAKKAIISGKLPAGSKFPSVRELSATLGVNRNTAHKAIGALVAEGWLTVRPRRGAMVTDTPKENLPFGQEVQLESLIVEARRAHLPLEQFVRLVRRKWHQLK